MPDLRDEERASQGRGQRRHGTARSGYQTTRGRAATACGNGGSPKRMDNGTANPGALNAPTKTLAKPAPDRPVALLDLQMSSKSEEPATRDTEWTYRAIEGADLLGGRRHSLPRENADKAHGQRRGPNPQRGTNGHIALGLEGAFGVA